MSEPLDAGTLDALRRIARYDTGQGEYAHVPCDVLGRLLDDHARLTAENEALRGLLIETIDDWVGEGYESHARSMRQDFAIATRLSAEAGDTD